MDPPFITSTGLANYANGFWNKICTPIVATTLVMMGSILSVNMYFYEHIRAFAELSTVTVYPSESNPILSEDSTLEESMWHVPSFEIVHLEKGSVLGVAFGRILS